MAAIGNTTVRLVESWRFMFGFVFQNQGLSKGGWNKENKNRGLENMQGGADQMLENRERH